MGLLSLSIDALARKRLRAYSDAFGSADRVCRVVRFQRLAGPDISMD
jgi:hypothetical protein